MVVEKFFPLNCTVKVAELAWLFSTINTFCPVGVTNATFCRLPEMLEDTRIDPGRTNLDACAMI